MLEQYRNFISKATTLGSFFDLRDVVYGIFGKRDHVFMVEGFYREATSVDLEVYLRRGSKSHMVHVKCSLNKVITS